MDFVASLSSNGAGSIDDCERNRVLLFAVIEALRERLREVEEIRCNLQSQADSDELLKKSFKKQLNEAKQALRDEKEKHEETKIALKVNRRSHRKTKALLKDEQRKYEDTKMQYDEVKAALDSETSRNSFTNKALAGRLKQRKEAAALKEEAEQRAEKLEQKVRTLESEQMGVKELEQKVRTLEFEQMRAEELEQKVRTLEFEQMRAEELEQKVRTLEFEQMRAEELEQKVRTLESEQMRVKELEQQVRTLESDKKALKEELIVKQKGYMKTKILELLEAIAKDHKMLYLKRDTQVSNFPNSKALIGLESFLDDLHKKYLVLSPQSGSVANCLNYLTKPGVEHPSLKEFIHGGVISTMCAWEAYIKNVLEEAFDIMIAECLGSEQGCSFPGNLYKMKKKWPYCQQAAHQKIKPACKSWKDYRKHILKDMRPLLLKHKEIDFLFNELFYPGEDKAQRILSSSIAGHRLTYPYRTKDDEEVMLQINNPQLLHDILRLYYGVRCTFAHGCNERTVNKGSCLYKFPNSPDELPLATVGKEHAGRAKEVAQELFCIYMGIRDHGRNVDVDYRTLVNLNAFILCTSRSMTLAIKEVLHRDFGIVVWNP